MATSDTTKTLFGVEKDNFQKDLTIKCPINFLGINLKVAIFAKKNLNNHIQLSLCIFKYFKTLIRH